MNHKAIRTFQDAVEFLGEVSLEDFAREQSLDALNLSDPTDRRALEIGIINRARSLRDFLEHE